MFKLSKTNKLDLLGIYKKAKHLYDDVPIIRRKRRQMIIFKVLKYFSYAVLVVFIVCVVLFFMYYKDFRLFYNTAVAGKNNIEKSVELILTGEYKEGNNMAVLAQENFYTARQIAEKYSNHVFLKNV